MKKMLVFLAIAMLAGAAVAQNWGLFDADRSLITIGGTDLPVWDSANVFGTTATPQNFGIVTSLILSDFDIFTWKGAGGDVTGGTFNWRVVGDATFQTVPLAFQENLANPGDQRWGFLGQTINIAAGKGPGSYQFEFYTEVTGTGDPVGPLYDNGGSVDNYRGSFQIQAIPEPATMSLLGLGALAMVLRRKIRK